MNKYGNRKIVVDGIAYDSKKEAKRGGELLLMQRAGMIHNLRRQVKYELIPAQYVDGKCVERACNYVADFIYIDDQGNTVVEDTKGFRTKDYIIKRKLMLFRHGVAIKEV